MYFGCSLFLLVFLFPHNIHAQDECDCTDVMVCPPNSNTSGYGAASVDDCVCDPGYMRLGEACVAVCPPNSTAGISGGCTCVDGFVLSGGVCVEMFRCPANSRPVGGGLVLSTLDCWCNEGFVRSDEGCVCSPNSVILLDGCECVSGYRRTFANESCVQESAPIAGVAVGGILGVAVGGSVVLVSSVWAAVQYFFMAPPAAVPAPMVPVGLLDKVRMTSQFIEYKV